MSSQRQNGRSPDSLPIGDHELRRLVHQCTDRLLEVERLLNVPRLHRLTGTKISRSTRPVDLGAILLNGLYQCSVKPAAATLQVIEMAIDPDCGVSDQATEMLFDLLLHPLTPPDAEETAPGIRDDDWEEES